jgi:IS30 family transposase
VVSGRYLSLEERLQIADLRLAGTSMRAIASQLGRAPSTISRELRRNGPVPTPAAGRARRGRYASYAAHKRAGLRARRPKPFKLDDAGLALAVQDKLCLKWSPAQISAHLAGEHGDEAAMRVSHETIYQALFVQGRGQLRTELHRHLRTGRAWRRPHGFSGATKAKISGMVSISERPAEAADRAVPGHWEGDLILGEHCRSAIGTLVERQTRFCLLVHLPDGHSAETVRDRWSRRSRPCPSSSAAR